MSFFHREAGLTLTERVKIPDIQMDLKVKELLLLSLVS